MQSLFPLSFDLKAAWSIGASARVHLMAISQTDDAENGSQTYTKFPLTGLPVNLTPGAA